MVNDVPILAELRSDGLHIRRLRARTTLHLSWARLWNMAVGQAELLFNEPIAPAERQLPGSHPDELPGQPRLAPGLLKRKSKKAKVLVAPVAAVLPAGGTTPAAK